MGRERSIKKTRTNNKKQKRNQIKEGRRKIRTSKQPRRVNFCLIDKKKIYLEWYNKTKGC